MQQWNRIATIKAIILVSMSLPNLLFPIEANPQQGFFASGIMPLLFGVICIPLIFNLNRQMLRLDISAPRWNDSPLSFKRPMSVFQFVAFFFLSIGLSMLVGSAWQYRFLNQLGLLATCFGLGLLIGIFLMIRWYGKKEEE